MAGMAPPDRAAEERHALLVQAPPAAEAAEPQVRDAHQASTDDLAERKDVRKVLRASQAEACGSEDPRPLQEIEGRGAAVLRDALIGLGLGMVPVLGWPVLAFMVWKYFWKHRGRYATADGDFRPGCLLRPLELWEFYTGGLEYGEVWLQIYCIMLVPYELLLAYKFWYENCEGQFAHFAVDCLRLEHFDGIVTIASMLLTRILAVHAEEVRTQTEYYKAKEKRRMNAEDEAVVARLALVSQRQTTSPLQRALVWVSTIFLLIGFTLLEALQFRHKMTQHWWVYLDAFLSPLINARGLYRMMVHLTLAPKRMQANAEQLLLFRAMASDEDCAEWRDEQKKTLQDIFSRNEDEISSKWEAAGKKPGTGIPDAHLGMVANMLIRGKATALDLTRLEDLRMWWQVRKYMVLDFTDESCIADCALAIASVVIVCFLALAFAGWSHHILPGMGTLCSRDSHDNALDKHGASTYELLQLILATVLAVVIITALVILLLILMNQCVCMNTLWAADHSMLLDAAINVELDDSKSPSEAAKTVRLLGAIQQRIEKYDRRQKLFGIVIDDRVISSVVLTLACAFLRVVWERLEWCFDNPEPVVQFWTNMTGQLRDYVSHARDVVVPANRTTPR